MPQNDTSPKAAREQEAEFFGIQTSYEYDLGEGDTWSLPFLRYFPPDMRARYDEHIRFFNEDVDMRDVEHQITGKVSKQPMYPPRLKGKLLNEDVLLCVALMGDADEDAPDADRIAYLQDGTKPDTYARFLAAGGVPGQIAYRSQMMNRQMEERLRRDSKSS